MPNRFYGSANDETKLVTRLYGGSSNGAVRISKLYGPVPTQVYYVVQLPNNPGFNTQTFMQKYESEYGKMLVPPMRILVRTISSSVKAVSIRMSPGTTDFRLFTYANGSYDNEGQPWGFAQEPVEANFGYSSTYEPLSKLIHQGFGHVKYIVPEHFSITPDGTIITAIDGETLCALAKSQYPNKYTQTVSATFRYRYGTYYISGQTSNSEDTFYKSGGVSAMTNAGVTFATGLSGDVSTTLPVTYVPETN